RRHTISKRDWSSDVCSSDLDQDAGEFAGRGGLSGAVDTDDHDHGRTVTVRFGAYEAIGVGADLGEEFFAQQGTDLFRAPGTEYFHPGAQDFHDLRGGGDTDVCGDEKILDLFPGVLVQCVGGEQVQQALPQGAL